MPPPVHNKGLVLQPYGKSKLTDLRPPRQDNTRAPAPPTPASPQLIDDFVMGLRFFSRLPAGYRPHEVPNLSRMAPAVPFVSLAIALLPALLVTSLSWLAVPGLFAAALGVAAMVLSTGAMPEDALADAADGLGGGSTIDRRLEIMKDSRHGTYGVTAIGLYLILRVVAYGTLAAINPLAAGGIMLASAILARSGSLWLSVDLPPAREGGAAASAGRPSVQAFSVGAVFALALTFAFAGPFAGILGVAFAVLAAAGVALFWTGLCRRLIGGQTGDLIGALHALIEIAALAVFMIFT